jgi:hypothetical protein
MMSDLNSLAGMASMAGPQGAAVGMSLSAIGGIGSAVGSLFGGPSTPKMPDDVNYARVADVQITEQGAGSVALVSTGAAQQPGVYQMRLAASVHQKKMKEEEATPLLQQKRSAAVAGNF